MSKKILLLILVLIFNVWIWKIFSFNVFAGVMVIFASLSLWLGVELEKGAYFFISLVATICLVFFQFSTSSKNSLTFLNSNEKLHQQVRMRGYPPVSIRFSNKTLWIPIANWLELRPEALIFYKLEANISEVIDPNLYFFANHPRERIGVTEYEKFPYILLPAFIIGLLSTKRKNMKYFVLAASPLVLNTIVGNSNPAGPFAIFPFFIISITSGLKLILSKRWLRVPAIILFCLVFVQVVSYAIY